MLLHFRRCVNQYNAFPRSAGNPEHVTCVRRQLENIILSPPTYFTAASKLKHCCWPRTERKDLAGNIVCAVLLIALSELTEYERNSLQFHRPIATDCSLKTVTVIFEFNGARLLNYLICTRW
jgi:hypothetical protein